eukprot:CAMPEP_0206434298 /NCGR_PEP_ID=MMETSP0324_2-20121206/9074_1 /ASSEMBLY_ACC=CAM_ASM_000836 /TAXON_ID=2866 /ORGANISM="Crypthecodinium cohnii, Strain Seligo" /LENGTH=107 /DNA_ID=CAMNT_0053900785 /DNA_START=112 /DNA_END=433 /DNA_ORIENTATION=-
MVFDAALLVQPAKQRRGMDRRAATRGQEASQRETGTQSSLLVANHELTDILLTFLGVADGETTFERSFWSQARALPVQQSMADNSYVHCEGKLVLTTAQIAVLAELE